MKYVRRLGIALLMFIVGVAVAPIQFYEEGSGRGKVIDGGGNFAVTVYTSSYFVKLWFAHESYVSPEKANDVFNQRLSQAVKVIEVGPKINGDGAVVGRRVIGLFFSPGISSYYIEVVWTDGRILHYIFSTSALHVKEFEKHQLWSRKALHNPKSHPRQWVDTSNSCLEKDLNNPPTTVGGIPKPPFKFHLESI